jgi:hypothetical protein
LAIRFSPELIDQQAKSEEEKRLSEASVENDPHQAASETGELCILIAAPEISSERWGSGWYESKMKTRSRWELRVSM